MTFLKRYFWVLPFTCFLFGYLIFNSMVHIDKIETPALVGKTLGQAVSILSDLNVNTRILAFKQDTDLPSETIISQSPAAKQKIKPYQSVFLVVSKQPQAPMAPACHNKPLEIVSQELEQLGIKPKLYFIPSSYPKDKCIAQQPSTHEPLVNKTITLYVSAPKNSPIIWPNFYKKRVSDVVEFLQSYTIKPEVIHYPELKITRHTCEQCLVINQRPLAGSLITLDEKNPLQVQLQVE
ncbi:MAG: PASTA domain-containing protein [bacterium]|nr:PASTA domain-containing protein [bacterium]